MTATGAAMNEETVVTGVLAGYYEAFSTSRSPCGVAVLSRAVVTHWTAKGVRRAHPCRPDDCDHACY